MSDTEPAPTPTTRRRVKLGDLVLEHKLWKNPRQFSGLDGPKFDELCASIAQHGILDEPKVFKVNTNGGSSFISLVWDGQRRVLAGLKELGKDAEIEVVDLTAEPIDLTSAKAYELTMRALEVGKRDGLSSYELAEVAADLRAGGKKLKEISDAIGKDESWVSRMLKARGLASPKTLFAWRKGELTDEQFKDIAASKADKQDEVADAVVDERKSGHKAEARALTKEIAETAKQKRAREKRERNEAKQRAKEERAAAKRAKAEAKQQAKVRGKKAPPASEPQVEMKLPDPPKAAKPPKKPSPSKVTLEQMVELAERRPPTHDLVKGILLGVRYALGDCTPEDFGKPWMQYLVRLGGSAKPAPVKKARAKTRATTTPKAKARKPAKQRSGKAIAKARKARKRG